MNYRLKLILAFHSQIAFIESSRGGFVKGHRGVGKEMVEA